MAHAGPEMPQQVRHADLRSIAGDSGQASGRFPLPCIKDSLDVCPDRSPCIGTVHAACEQPVINCGGVAHMGLDSELDRLWVESLCRCCTTDPAGMSDASVFGYQGACRGRTAWVHVADMPCEVRKELLVPVLSTQSGSHPSSQSSFVILQAFLFRTRQRLLFD